VHQLVLVLGTHVLKLRKGRADDDVDSGCGAWDAVCVDECAQLAMGEVTGGGESTRGAFTELDGSDPSATNPVTPARRLPALSDLRCNPEVGDRDSLAEIDVKPEDTLADGGSDTGSAELGGFAVVVVVVVLVVVVVIAFGDSSVGIFAEDGVESCNAV